MAELSPAIAAEVRHACQTGAAEAAKALGRGLDVELNLSVGEPAGLQMPALSDVLSGPGLAVVFVVAGQGALLLIPESTDLLPGWCASPDATGQSKLATLAQELGTLLLPEQYMPDDFKALYVRSLAGALAGGGASEDAVSLPLELWCSGELKGVAPLIWPIVKPGAVVGGAGTACARRSAEPQPSPGPEAAGGPAPASEAPRPAPPASVSVEQLPAYARSLLRIKVPVVVTLASKKQSLGRVLELAPGCIVQFDKSCEEMLELEAADLPIGLGEAVKVGDKFGLRITSMLLPDERFLPVRPRQAGRV
jgi:flagellar motor switch/type III secretory pathway protein FliN